MKAYNDKKIISKQFEPNDQVVLYNFRLTYFPGKLRSRWSGPFTVVNALILITNPETLRKLSHLFSLSFFGQIQRFFRSIHSIFNPLSA